MEYSDSFLKDITKMGALYYPLSKIINILDPDDPERFARDFFTNKEILKAYEKGKDQADFTIDSKLYILAKSGDVNAIREFEARRKVNASEFDKQFKIDQLKYGDDF